jgi:hypothetical protein
MSGIQTGKLFSLILRSAVMTCAVSCGMDTGTSVATQAVGPSCAVGSPEQQWTNRPLQILTGRVHAELLVTPSESPIDAVVGFSDGAASWFPALAAIVRFNPSGAIDVRAGSEYQADAEVPYTAGVSYRFHIDIDIGRHIYSVAVDDPAGGSISLARNYPFRTEQAQVGQLSNLAVQVDSDSGSLTACPLSVSQIDTSCPLAEADSGFVTTPFGQPGDFLVSSEFVATPDEILDGVFGLSFGPATGFNDLAAAVRLSPDGVIDARNGDHFQADAVLPYSAGQPQHIRILANRQTHTFSAYAASPGDQSSVQFARGYAFRPTQLGVPGLDTLNAIVDSPRGIVSVCNERHAISVGVRSFHEGNYAVAPLATGQQALIATDTTTQRVAGDGLVLATLAAGGQVAADPAGNVYLARVSGTDLVVEAYTAGFAPRWTRTFPVGTDMHLVAIGADAASVVVATGQIQFPRSVARVKRWLADGTESFTYTGAQGDAIAIGPVGFVIGQGRRDIVSVKKWSFDRDMPDWSDRWTSNKALIDAIAIAPSGRVYFGGTFPAPISFGGPILEPQPGDPGHVYIEALAATGEHVYTRDLHQLALRSIASGGPITAVSALNAPGGPKLIALDSTGQLILPEDGMFPFAARGDAGTVAVDPTGRVYWNFSEAWPTVSAPAYPFLVSLDPGV